MILYINPHVHLLDVDRTALQEIKELLASDFLSKMQSCGDLVDTENCPADDAHRQSDSIHRRSQKHSPLTRCIMSVADHQEIKCFGQGRRQKDPSQRRELHPTTNSANFDSKRPSDGTSDDSVQYALVPEYLVKLMETDMNNVVLPKYGRGSDSEPPTICRVPKELKGNYEHGYRPVAVELGLFAPGGGDHALQAYKWCCLRNLISRHHLLPEPERTPVLLRRCLGALGSLEPRIRSSYHPREPRHGGDVSQTDQLLHNMLLDGCFILHLLLKYARMHRREVRSTSRTGTGSDSDNDGEEDEVQVEEEDDDWTQMFGRCWVWGFVTSDLLLLENQIPFFVVHKLFQQLRTDPAESSHVLVDGALRLFHYFRPRKLLHSSPIIAYRDVHHLLHLFYISVGLLEAQPGDPSQHAAAVPPSELPQWIPCARELEEAGVRFRARRDGKSFLDVKFHGGVLEIPELQLYDYSEPLFRNLIAFEKTYPFTPGNVTSYAIFMECLVTSPEDMRLLLLSGVLVNQMNGEREGTGFFGRICAEAHLAADNNYLADVIQDINRYQRSRWSRWRAALVRDYFRNPWVAMSLIAAIFLLVPTAMQSFFAAYSYFKPPKQH